MYSAQVKLAIITVLFIIAYYNPITYICKFTVLLIH